MVLFFLMFGECRFHAIPCFYENDGERKKKTIYSKMAIQHKQQKEKNE